MVITPKQRVETKGSVGNTNQASNQGSIIKLRTSNLPDLSAEFYTI